MSKSKCAELGISAGPGHMQLCVRDKSMNGSGIQKPGEENPVRMEKDKYVAIVDGDKVCVPMKIHPGNEHLRKTITVFFETRDTEARMASSDVVNERSARSGRRQPSPDGTRGRAGTSREGQAEEREREEAPLEEPATKRRKRRRHAVEEEEGGDGAQPPWPPALIERVRECQKFVIAGITMELDSRYDEALKLYKKGLNRDLCDEVLPALGQGHEAKQLRTLVDKSLEKMDKLRSVMARSKDLPRNSSGDARP